MGIFLTQDLESEVRPWPIESFSVTCTSNGKREFLLLLFLIVNLLFIMSARNSKVSRNFVSMKIVLS